MRHLLPLALLLTAGCAAQPAGGFSGNYEDHEETMDFALLRGGSFDRNHVVNDAFFTNTTLVTADDLQAFFETNPYGRRSFLADHRVGGQLTSQVLVETAQREGLNPIMLLARMQVEKSLVSATSNPGGNRVDYAFGCGCPDNRPCNTAYKGLDRQIECGAQTHMRLFRRSQDGSGQWRQGRGRNTLDPLRVTPANHATASLYAYTPWVLQGRGGNWLVWNVVNRYVDHLISMGRITESELETGGSPGGVERRWIGSTCENAGDCALGLSGEACHATANMCVSSCEGYCPDRDGFATTFCVSLDGASGTCVPKSASQNGSCNNLPGTEARSMQRFIGSSSARAGTATVCVPTAATPEPTTEPEPMPEPMPTPTSDPLCNETCGTAGNGVCEDGGRGASYEDCSFGSDCADCGRRVEEDRSPATGMCTNTCRWARDGECDDGGAGSVYSACELGTDCADCGAR